MSADPLQTAQLVRDLVAAELQNYGFAVEEALVNRRPTLFVERAGVRRRVRVSANVVVPGRHALVTRDQLHVCALGYEELTGENADLIEVLNLDAEGKSTRDG